MPTLRLPISVPNMSEFERQMDGVKNRVGDTALKVVEHFQKINSAGKALGAGLIGAAGFTQAAAGVVGAAGTIAARLAATAAVAYVFNAAIEKAQQQLAELLDVANKSARAGTSAVFFQSWIDGAHGATEKVKALEEALIHANEATKIKIKSDLTVQEASDGRVADINKIEALLRDYRELFDRAGRFQGLELFRNAQNQDQKILAVFQAMRELEAAGQRLASLDIAEQMFGASFAEKLRKGELQLDKLTQNLKNKIALAGDAQGGGIFSEKQVALAKELDERLTAAHNTIQQNLKPSFEDLNAIALRLKGVWVEIVETMARASTLIPRSQAAAEANRNEALAESSPDNMPVMANPQILRQRARMRAARGYEDPIPEGAAYPPGQRYEEYQAYRASDPTPGAPVPMPRTRPQGIQPDKKSEEAEAQSSFEREEERIKRSIALEYANASAVGKTSEERSKMRAELALLNAASKDGDNVTEEQIDTYARLRASMSSTEALQQSGIKLTGEQAESFDRLTKRVGEAAGAHERAKNAFQGVNDALRFGGNELINVIDRATHKGAKFGDIMADVLRNIGKQFLQAALTGEGAFAKLFGLAGRNGGVGGILGLLGSLLGGPRVGAAAVGPSGMVIGGNAEGTGNFAGGWTMVGERGPEILNLPSGTGIVPNGQVDVAMSRIGGGGGNPISVSYQPIIDARGASEEAIMRLEAQTQRIRNELPAIIVKTVRDARWHSVPLR